MRGRQQSATSEPIKRITDAIADHPLVAFLLLTFGWSWGWDLLVYVLVGASPSIFVPPWTLPRTWGLLFATSVVLMARGERVREFLRGVITVPRRWWLLPVALALPIVLGELSSVLALVSGSSLTGIQFPYWAYLANFLLVFLVAGGLEEFGWRAFAQPRLQTRYPAVLVAVGIGVVWATWHLPLFLIFELEPYDPANLPIYYVTLVMESMALAWLFNETEGSVLAPMAFHAAGNLPGVLSISGSAAATLGVLGEHGYLLTLVLFVVVVIAVRGIGLAADRLQTEFYY